MTSNISIECEDASRASAHSNLGPDPSFSSSPAAAARPRALGLVVPSADAYRRTCQRGHDRISVHSGMFAEAGLPFLLAAAFEMNPFLITLMTGAAASHEVTAMLDVRLALKSRRHVSQWEQHVHSFLEAMPFWIVPLMIPLNEPVTNQWPLTRRAVRLSKRDLAVVAAGSRSQECFPTPKSLFVV